MSPFAKRAFKLFLKLTAGLLVIFFISLLLLLWRLSSSPIQLNQFVPKIEQAASNMPGGISVRLKSIGLYWNRSEKQIDLRASDVELVETSGTSLVKAPEVDISLSVFAMLHGVVALSSIELQGVDVQLVRNEDGSFQIFKKTSDRPAVDSDNKPRDFTETIQHMAKVLASEAKPDAPLSYLKKVKIKGSLEVEDRKSGLNWAADAVESLFIGHKGQITGDLGVTFSSPQALDDIRTDISLTLKDDVANASLEFEGIDMARIATLDQRLATLAGLDMRFNGTIKTKITLPDTIHSLAATVKGGAGQFTYRDFYPDPIKLNSLELQLSTDLPGKTIQVSSLDISLGETATPLKLHLNGAGQMVENAASLSLEAELQQLKADEFDLYWPKSVALGARNWLVSNLKAGTVNNAKLKMAMLVPTGQESNFQLKELKGTVAFSGLTVTYFGELPPAIGVTGSGTFDQRGFDLGVTKGRVNGVSIDSGKVVISGMDDGNAAISIDAHLNGSLAATFAVLEAPPLEVGIDTFTDVVSKQLGGQVESNFSIALPLKPGLADDDIQYRANGKISGGSFRNVLRDYDLQAANLDFKLDQSKVNLSGPLEFSGVPLVLDWTTYLNGSDKGHADFTINTPNLTANQITSLGFDMSEYMQGSFALKTKAKLAPGGQVTATVETNFNDAALAVPQIHWNKAIGEGGKIDFVMSVKKDHLHIKNIFVELGALKTNGDVEFDMAGPVMSLSLEHLSLSYAQLKGLKLERDESKNLKFTLQGGEASLAPFLSGGDQKKDPQEKKVAEQSKALAVQLKSSGIVFEIEKLKLDKVHLNKDTYFDNILFSGRRDSSGWQEVRLSGHNPFAGGNTDANSHPEATGSLESGQFSLAFGPAVNSQYPLSIETEDLGSIVSAVKGRNIMKNGYLVLNGESEGPLFTKPIKATFNLNHFTMKEAPAISSVLNMASLTQIISTFRQTGLAFNSASGDIQLDGPRLSSTQIRANGGSLGLLGGGWTDLKTQKLGLHGTVIPLNNLNKLVGKIPLFGKIVVGKDGKGIMAVDFTVRGTVSQPEASIRKEALTTDLLDKTVGEDKEGTSPNPQ